MNFPQQFEILLRVNYFQADMFYMKYYNPRYYRLISFSLLIVISCQQNQESRALITSSRVAIDSTFLTDQEIEKVILPYRQKLDSIMGEVDLQHMTLLRGENMNLIWEPL